MKAFSSIYAYFLAVLCVLPQLVNSQNLPYLIEENGETKVNQELYGKYLLEHPFATRPHLDKKQIKAMPKKDRPDLAWEQDYLRTMDPLTGKPMPERLWPIFRSLTNNSLPTAAPGSSTSNQWTERGPNNVGGRTRAIAFDPNDASRKKVWAAGVTGGLWVNNDITSASSSWTSVGNMWSNIAVTAIAFDPNSSSTIYVGTGEGWGGAAQSGRGAGIWKSTNGGSTFTQLTSTTSYYYVNDLVVRNESGISVVYAAVANKYYKGQWHGSALGLYRSNNGGTSWTQTLPNISGAPYEPADIEIAADNRMWIGTTNNGYGNGGGTILYSDNGTTWVVSTSFSGSERVELACAPSDSATVYGIVEKNNVVDEIIKTSNHGSSWSKSSTSSSLSEPADADNGIPNTDFSRGQAWYDLIAAVSPGSADTVVVGGIDLFMSVNGGQTWVQISKWSNNNNLFFLNCSEVHADQHQIVFRPGKNNELLVGNDGGVYYCSDLKTSQSNDRFSARNKGYNITQFYAGAINPGANSNIMLAGAQDNGTQRYTTSGINSTAEVRGGDGAYCFIDQTNGNYAIASYVYNTYRLSTNAGASFSPSNDLIDDQTTGSFINPADYDNGQHILFSAKTANSLHRIKDITTASSPPVDSVVISGFGGMPTAITASPYGTTASTVFVGNGIGKVYKITNAHSSSPTVTNIGGSATLPTSSVSCIEVGASDNELIVTFSNYGTNSVWYTSNGGSNWISKEGNLPDMPVRWALFNPANRNEVILATEVGVWSTSDISVSSPTWVASNQGLANVRTDMLQYRTSDSTVMAITHGRGVYTGKFAAAPTGPITPVASFTNSNSSICSGQTVTFTSTSTNSPTSLLWTFPGGSPSSSTSSPVTVTYAAAGSYSVKLKATNSAGSDSLTKSNLVVVTSKVKPTASTISSICTNTPTFALNNCTPTGGVYSGPGVSSGNFNAASAGSGLKSIKYKLGTGQCADSVNFFINVGTASPTTLGSIGPFCTSDPTQILNQGSPTGGVYSGTGVTGSSFSPSTAGTGNHTVMYIFTNTGGCQDSATTVVSVVNTLTVTASAVPSQCSNGGPIMLSNGAPSGGIYSGNGVSGGSMFYPDSAGVGTHTIKYKAGSGNCIDSTTFQITVNAAPSVSIASLGPLCVSGSPVTLVGTPSGTGGIFSGTGVSSGMFSPSTAGLGSHTIKYVYTDANSCTDSANTSVVVNSGSLLTFSAIPTVCGSVAPFTLTQGSPAGGKYSGIGVTNDSIFNPSIAGVGTHTITYSDSAACGAKSVVQTVTVSAGPTLVTSNDTGYCVGGSVQISVSGAKTYTWSNAGSLNNATSPTPIASPTVTTNFVVIGLDSNGCQGKDSVLVSVYPNPSIDAGPDDTVCVGDTFQLNATGAVNYRWFPGVGLLATNIPNPKGSLTGDQVYFCEGTSAHGCKATDRINIVVQTGQQVSLAPLSSVCSSDTAFALSGGTPAGGVYLGTGVVNNLVFNPALAGVGTHSITYASGLSGSCITKDSQNIVVFAGPQILWSNIGTSCEGDQPVVLSATPAGGTYSGSGVSGNTFDPTSAGGGNHIIKYEITDGNGCKASMTQSVAVNKATKIDSIFGQNNAVKSKVYSYSVKAVNGSTYQWSVTGGSLISQTANTGTVRWGKGTSGSVGVTQTNPEGCQDSARMEVAINVLGDEEFTLSGQSLRMYPNPSDDELNISFGDLRGLITITVIDALGKVVLNQEFESDGKSEMVIDLSNQVEGTYFLQLNNGEDKISKPFIIKR